MMTVVDDTCGNHWGNMGGRCSTRLYQLRDSIKAATVRAGKLTEALALAVSPVTKYSISSTSL